MISGGGVDEGEGLFLLEILIHLSLASPNGLRLFMASGFLVLQPDLLKDPLCKPWASNPRP